MGGWADEGKGKATQYYLKKYKNNNGLLCIRSSGGTNTGATVYTESGDKLSIHMLPVGAFMPNCHAYIGNAVYVNFKILLDELELRHKVNEHLDGKVFLSKYAHVVTKDCLERDAAKEAEQKMGSTKNGVSIAASDKYSYRGTTVQQALRGERNKDMLMSLWSYGVKIVDPFEFFRKAEMAGWNMVLEGTQGVGLDVNHGFEYPYVSSGSFSTFGLLDGVGYALAPTDVCMVLKPYGSYFGPLRELGDFEDNEFRKFAGEFGTTTNRPRNLCWLDIDKIQKVASLTKPTAIMINCMDKLDWFIEHGKPWCLVTDNSGQKIEFHDRPIVKGKLTRAGTHFIKIIEEMTDAPVKFLGVGPRHDDIIER